MARTVKKKEQSPEEKLAAALVPEEEQPYKIPGNWCWVRLLDTFYNLTDSKRKIQQKNYLENGSIAVVDQGQEVVGGYTDDEDMLFMGELPVIVFGDHTRCIKYVDFPFAQGADGVKILAPKKCYEPRAFYYALQNVNIPNMGYRRHYPLFKEYFIPLPPLPEQQRIVILIESLFADLDKAKEKLTSVVEGFALRKTAILHQAFTGELTAKWREETAHKNEWEEVTLESVCKSIFDGDHQPPPKSEEGIPFLVISNVNTGYLSFENTRYVTREYYDALSENRKAEEGDVLYTLVGSYGIPVVVDSNKPFCFQRHMALLKPAKISTRFLWYQLQSYEFYNKATEIATGTAQLTVPIKGLRKLTIMTTTEEEQAEVVNMLDDLLLAEQQAQSAVETVLADIDTLKKSILTRAFRGELGTGDPEEERAEELLKRVL